MANLFSRNGQAGNWTDDGIIDTVDRLRPMSRQWPL